MPNVHHLQNKIRRNRLLIHKLEGEIQSLRSESRLPNLEKSSGSILKTETESTLEQNDTVCPTNFANNCDCSLGWDQTSNVPNGFVQGWGKIINRTVVLGNNRFQFNDPHGDNTLDMTLMPKVYTPILDENNTNTKKNQNYSSFNFPQAPSYECNRYPSTDQDRYGYLNKNEGFFTTPPKSIEITLLSDNFEYLTVSRNFSFYMIFFDDTHIDNVDNDKVNEEDAGTITAQVPYPANKRDNFSTYPYELDLLEMTSTCLQTTCHSGERDYDHNKIYNSGDVPKWVPSDAATRRYYGQSRVIRIGDDRLRYVDTSKWTNGNYKDTVNDYQNYNNSKYVKGIKLCAKFDYNNYGTSQDWFTITLSVKYDDSDFDYANTTTIFSSTDYANSRGSPNSYVNNEFGGDANQNIDNMKALYNRLMSNNLKYSFRHSFWSPSISSANSDNIWYVGKDNGLSLNYPLYDIATKSDTDYNFNSDTAQQKTFDLNIKVAF